MFETVTFKHYIFMRDMVKQFLLASVPLCTHCVCFMSDKLPFKTPLYSVRYAAFDPCSGWQGKAITFELL